MKKLIAGLFLITAAFRVFAREMSPEDQAKFAAANTACCGSCGALGIFVFILPIVLILINIMLLVWVAKDAKNRGMDNAVVWMILVFFTGFIGLIIYVLARSKGNLKICASCKNSRLETSAKCPHCGNA